MPENGRQKLLKKIDLLEKLKRRKIAEKGLESIYFFNRDILERGHPKRQEKIVPHVHGEWERWLQRSKKRIKLLLVPRNSLKSTFLTVGKSLQEIARNQDVRILVANAVEDNARKFLDDIKTTIKGNEAFIENYGELFSSDETWKSNEINVAGRSSHVREPTVTATGAGGSLVSQHYDFIFGDDLVNENNAFSRDMSQKTIDWVKRALSLLDPEHGEMYIVGTRWSHYDLYSYLMTEMKDSVDVLVRSAYNEDGSLYYPEMLSKKFLEDQRRNQKSYIFSSFYLNDPVDEESAIVKKDMIHYIGDCVCGADHRLPNLDDLAVFSACDPAFATSASNDFTGIITVGVDNSHNWWVLEALSGKWTTQELIDQVFKVYKEWKPITFAIELMSGGQTLMDSIMLQESERGIYLPIKKITYRPGIGKEMRIRGALESRFERNKVFFGQGMTALEDQLVHFPHGKFDDLIDALATINDICFSPSGEPEDFEAQPVTIQEKVDKHLERKTKVFVDDIMGGYW